MQWNKSTANLARPQKYPKREQVLQRPHLDSSPEQPPRSVSFGTRGSTLYQTLKILPGMAFLLIQYIPPAEGFLSCEVLSNTARFEGVKSYPSASFHMKMNDVPADEGTAAFLSPRRKPHAWTPSVIFWVPRVPATSCKAPRHIQSPGTTHHHNSPKHRNTTRSRYIVRSTCRRRRSPKRKSKQNVSIITTSPETRTTFPPSRSPNRLPPRAGRTCDKVFRHHAEVVPAA